MTGARRCGSCGASNLDDAEYCAACGLAIDTAGLERPWLAALADDDTPERPDPSEPTSLGTVAAPHHSPTDPTSPPDPTEPAATEPAASEPVRSPRPAAAAASGVGATAVGGTVPAAVSPPPSTGGRPWLAPTIAVFVVLALAATLIVLLATSSSESGETGTVDNTIDSSIDPAASTTEPAVVESTATPATTAGPSTTASAPTTVTAVDPAADLTSIAAADRDRVLALQGRWVPQLSAKQDGTEWEGRVYDLAAILDLHRELDDRVGPTLLVEGTTLAFMIDGERMAGWWITLADRDFDDPDGALAWCTDAGFDRANCAARLLTDDDSATGTLRLQST